MRYPALCQRRVLPLLLCTFCGCRPSRRGRLPYNGLGLRMDSWRRGRVRCLLHSKFRKVAASRGKRGNELGNEAQRLKKPWSAAGATGPARRLPPAAGMRQGAATHALLFITVLLPGSGGFLLPSQGVGCAGFYRSICVHGARDGGSHRATVLDAARKGDGKKPRLAKEGGGRQGSSSGGRQGSSSGGPGSAKGGGEAGARDGGPRIRNDIGMSMKTQLRLVKAFKQMEAKQASTKTVVRTGFRRKKATVQSSQDSSAPEMLRDIWNQRETPSHFFLDGYNIIGYWPKLKKKRDKGDMSGARDALFEAVSQFAHFRGCQCTLVYDAAGNTHGAPATSADMSRQGVEVVFVREESADRSLFVSLACARCRCGDLHRVPTRAGSLHALSLSVRFPFRDPCRGVTH